MSQTIDIVDLIKSCESESALEFLEQSLVLTEEQKRLVLQQKIMFWTNAMAEVIQQEIEMPVGVVPGLMANWTDEEKRQFNEDWANDEFLCYAEEQPEIPEALESQVGEGNKQRRSNNTKPEDSFTIKCNKYGDYPLGHPEIITENFAPIDTYFGLVKCSVLPPRSLYHPVLPHCTEDKLMFPLCRTCTDTLQQEPCNHLDVDRAPHGTWVTLELQKALEKGYCLFKIDEVWHSPNQTDGLFKDYVDTFLKIKQEASGYPADCDTEEKRAQNRINCGKLLNLGITQRDNALAKPDVFQK
ncbi:Hypothetical predicted protein [Paramuricea clavata]|uniref:Uncharacterized protein n=1 Tax=Paramuricea clavata TaxID=317549 RepID=A0A7D9EYI1_PARCT|nr:Hypothetical predicted protein [Paramuricea clavata]